MNVNELVDGYLKQGYDELDVQAKVGQNLILYSIIKNKYKHQ